MPKIDKPYNDEVLEYMKLFYENLSEKDQRYYAAVEAKRLGHGGVEFISKLFGTSTKTITRGLEDMKKKVL